ncbi:3-oxoacyl-[acyl-carrier protein] reductase [Rhodothalassium salexigens DSM 2132]|uniref:3-oxoacyl-[acyl-carrier protein] reductase n=1 Tax=Rhodothalassium salexigens DSM 2132 TaxID=1188247 RepID=A0A4R2PCR6_RHOSA|nr:SDR family NAD(P)-dependent oxidoreductase [Rhodothalassium salexigens]MBB4212096.1 3-oxoacyl-[acyl-carrier protein] reductase [Rhodothalassium salexigens DSM 2132]MBK1638312.1 hypothetical protein [Rhodothalassium salexigens DSM 2132]TCP32970.1 3-oxoacyl-[acyl-carrier protein] reductase [Rhodothalassium salexigens DSM 2132]
MTGAGGLAGRRLAVTGAGGHLGRAIVAGLTAHGATVAGIDRLAADGPEGEGAGTGEAETAGTIVADLSDYDAAGRALGAACDRLGGLDGLVNAAGLIHSQPLINVLAKGDARRHGADDWRRVLDANLTSTFNASVHAADLMTASRTRGVIVSLSSVAAAGNAGQSAYAAAKAGVEALTRTWARELGPLGIRCVAIAPGFIDTASTAAALSEATIRHLKRALPLKRLGSPDAVVEAVLFALTNPYLTGEVIRVDGGFSA